LRAIRISFALRVDVLHPELPAGHRQRPGQPGRKTAGYVLDDVRGQQVVEQFLPRRIRLREGDDGLLAASSDCTPVIRSYPAGSTTPGCVTI